LIVDKGGGEKGVEGVSKQGEHLSAIMMMVAGGGGPLWCRGCGWQQGGAMGSAECGKGPYERVRGQGETGGGAGRLCNTVVNGNGQ